MLRVAEMRLNPSAEGLPYMLTMVARRSEKPTAARQASAEAMARE